MRRLLLFPFVLLAAASIGTFAQSVEQHLPVDVPDINKLAITLVKPAFPETATAADADGETVSVRVVVNEVGTPVSAVCSLTCHPMLKDAAESAAIQSKFKPFLVDGKPVAYRGQLLFTFVVARVNWFRFATALESTRQFDNISLGPVAQILTAEFAAEKEQLKSLDANGGVAFEPRQKGISEVTASLRSKLKGADLWWFELGLALRRVTFWPQAGERIDRAELEKAIAALPARIASPPEGVSEPLLAELTKMSKYQIPENISERELRDAITNMYRGMIPHLK